MKTNWIEEFKQKWTECNCNKGFDYGQCERMEVINGGHGMARNDIIDFITTLLEKQREEILNKIDEIDTYGDTTVCDYYDGIKETTEKIKTIIKSHDK